MLSETPGTGDLPADVIALTIEGGLEKEDVDRAMGLLDAAFARGGKVHLFVEVRNFTGMPADAWLSDLRHGLRYLTKLHQFGRVAIVSDQSWVRAASRIESALLPFVTYHVYRPGQRDHALAWARGDVSDPQPPALQVTGADGQGIITIELNGRITPQAVDALADTIVRLGGEGRSLRLLAKVHHYEGFDPALLLNPKYVELKLSLLRHVARYALVGGPDWMARVAALADPLLTMDLRYFPADEEAAARIWLMEMNGKG
ncbi:SpoIIAA family protein [Novosphingobium rosa]|uniref:STAS/SEC14 domain-containing protein n=1 Tax=Novosphingobium rosa TaxID=76978 RepID=UPI0008366640|nr:STAS/SEC14 domain-containing protein [Novosphingobium rosa]